jgi:hypothetical protein
MLFSITISAIRGKTKSYFLRMDKDSWLDSYHSILSIFCCFFAATVVGGRCRCIMVVVGTVNDVDGGGDIAAVVVDDASLINPESYKFLAMLFLSVSPMRAFPSVEISI